MFLGVKMFDTMNKILVLSPHADDCVLGCGGFIARLIEEERDVYYATFSICEASVPSGLPLDILMIEAERATAVLGIPKDNLNMFRFEVRQFPAFRQDILEELIKFRNNLKPDMVLLPSLGDLHQDHKTIAEEGLRAFKGTSILGYEIPWNNINLSTDTFIILEEEHVTKKIEALKCFESQSFRNYADERFVKSLARTRGYQIEREYAEVYEAIRWVIR